MSKSSATATATPSPKAKPKTKSKSAAKRQAIDTLETNHQAISLSFRSLGLTRRVDESDRCEAAVMFEADSRSLAMQKKLLDTKNPAYAKVNSLKAKIRTYWLTNSLPYPEETIRLFKRSDIDQVVADLEAMKKEFEVAVEELENVYQDLVGEAKARLGRLYNPSDYPASILGSFDVTWRFHRLDPPDYLLTFKPELYRQEQQKMQDRFAEAVRMAEQAFAAEFGKLVSHLSEKLAGTNEEGKRNILKTPAIDNLTEFFDKFQKLNIRSNPELDKLVSDAKRMVQGITTDEIRHNYELRDKLAGGMDLIKEQLDEAITVEPSRRVKRGGYAALED
jgi:hypothetical protein